MEAEAKYIIYQSATKGWNFLILPSILLREFYGSNNTEDKQAICFFTQLDNESESTTICTRSTRSNMYATKLNWCYFVVCMKTET